MEWDIVWVWCPSLPKVGMLEVGCGGQQQQRVMGAISRSSPSFGGGVEEERPKAMTRCGVVGVVVASSLRRCRIARAREPSNEPSNQLGGCVCVWLCVDLRTSPTPHIHPPTPLQHPEYLSRGPRHNQQPHTLTHVNATVPAISHHTHTPRSLSLALSCFRATMASERRFCRLSHGRSWARSRSCATHGGCRATACRCCKCASRPASSTSSCWCCSPSTAASSPASYNRSPCVSCV